MISDRSRAGFVTLTHPHALPIVYTLDGSEPGAASTVYQQPISLPDGGVVRAAILTPEGRLGLVGSRTIVGVAPTGWSVVRPQPSVANPPQFPDTNAIDADAATLWRDRATTGDEERPTLTVDMGCARWIGGFAYLPRQDWDFGGVVDRYTFETSLDGIHWTKNAESIFGNIRNNPMLQETSFAPVEARFFRFTALHDVDDNGWVGAAEITVLPAPAAATAP